MDIYWAFVFTLAGLAIGSFSNVLADRLPAGQSVVHPASHCPQCHQRLAVRDLVPVVSYIVLRGRCRYCGAAIPRRTLLLELATALMFLGLFLFFGLSIELVIALFYFSLLLLVLVIDAEHQLILNVIIYPAAVLVLIINALTPDIQVTPGFLNGLAGGGIGLVLFLLIVILSRGGMGLGDVKMAALMGFMLGFPDILVAIMLAVISGGLVAFATLVAKKKDKRQPIAFGPFLAVGTMAAFLWADPLLEWYLGLFGI